MKKVFLSLATIAFVAAGSLTMTSCGSDDSSTTPGPGPEPTEQTMNTALYDGEEYPLTASELSVEYVVYNAGSENEFEGPAVYIIDGVGYNNYTQYAYSLNAAGNDIEDMTILGYLVKNTSIVIDNGQLADLGQLIAPNAITEYEFNSAGARLGGNIYNQSVTEGKIEYSSFNANSTSDTELAYEGTAVFNNSYKNSGELLSTKFNGPILMYQEVADAAAKGIKFKDVQSFKKEYVKQLKAKGITKASLKLTK